MKRFIPLVAAGLMLAGCAASPEPASPSTVTETVTTTETVTSTPPPADVTPAACIDALDRANDIFALAQEGFSAASDGFYAASMFDIDGLDASSAHMETVAGQIGDAAPGFKAARDECLVGAR